MRFNLKIIRTNQYIGSQLFSFNTLERGLVGRAIVVEYNATGSSRDKAIRQIDYQSALCSLAESLERLHPKVDGVY